MAGTTTLTQSEFRSLARKAGFKLKIKSYSEFAAVTHVNGEENRTVSFRPTEMPALIKYHQWNSEFQVLDGAYRTVK
jgi:hypothetical protein